MAPENETEPAEQIISATENPPNGVAGKHREIITNQ